MELLLSFVKRNSATANVPSRNIYDEFFVAPHECHPNHTSVLTFPLLPTIKEFVDAVSQRSCDNLWLSGLPMKTSTSTQEKEDWMYKILTQECFSCPLVRKLFSKLREVTVFFPRSETEFGLRFSQSISRSEKWAL